MKTIKKTILSFTLVFFMMILPFGDSAGMVTAQAQTMVYVTPTGSKIPYPQMRAGKFLSDDTFQCIGTRSDTVQEVFWLIGRIFADAEIFHDNHEEDNEEKEHPTEDKSAVDQQYKDCACKRTEQETYGKGWCRNRFLGQQ